jgi:hypothetical protein
LWTSLQRISVDIPDDLGQNQVVPFENAEPKFLECCIESRGETLVVVVRYVGDGDDVDETPCRLWSGLFRPASFPIVRRSVPLLSKMSISAVGRIRP